MTEENKKLIIYSSLIGAALGDIAPTPADALYFYTEKKLRDKWKNGEITPSQYWTKEALAYYGYNPLWWLIVLGITFSIKGGINHKIYAAGGLVGAGAVIGILYRNTKQDIKQLELEKVIK